MKKQQKKSVFRRLSEKGHEILSSVPKTVSVKFRRPVSEHQRFRQWLDAESKKAALEGKDTYEEFMNFGHDDEDRLPNTEYELVFDPFSGREVLPREKMFLDAQRAEFDKAQKLKKNVEKPDKDPGGNDETKPGNQDPENRVKDPK